MGDAPQLLASLSVVFGVAVFHFGHAVAEMTKFLAEDDPPKGQRHARIVARKRARTVLISAALPSFLILASVLVVMLPSFVQNLSTLRIAYWELDESTTLYQILFIVIAFYLAVSGRYVARITQKLWALRDAQHSVLT